MHAHHGPIDLIVSADGVDVGAVLGSVFPPILPALVAELHRLRRPVCDGFAGPVARHMGRAVAPFRDDFITPMAAVAGSVADHVLAALVSAGATRAWVNNGGDIALHLDDGPFRVGLCADPETGRAAGVVELRRGDGIGGVATSGWRGRSHSMGVADAVTVLAGSAAAADAAATMIANATDLPGHGGVTRHKAAELSPDSDLGMRLVVTGVATLGAEDARAALRAGQIYARGLLARGLIRAAFLDVQGQFALVSDETAPQLLEPLP